MDFIDFPKVKLEDAVVKNQLNSHVKTEGHHSEMDWCTENENRRRNQNSSDMNKFYGTMLSDFKYKSTPLFVIRCSLCSQALLNKHDVYRHNLTHMKVVLNPLRVYKCHHCSIHFLTKTLLISHIYSAHSKLYYTVAQGKKTHKCRVCYKTFIYYRNWYEHVKYVHASYKIKCENCNVTYKTERTYKRHPCLIECEYKKLKKECDEKSLVHCEDCPRVFSHKTQLTLHMKNCHNIIVKKGRKVLSPQRLDCEECGAVFKSAEYLKTHTRRVHYNDGKPHFCGQCGKKYKSPRCVRIHIQNVHKSPKPPPQQCKICLKVIKSEKNFKIHIQKCGELLKCDKCLKVIKSRKWFKQHIKSCVTKLDIKENIHLTFDTKENFIKTEINVCV